MKIKRLVLVFFMSMFFVPVLRAQNSITVSISVTDGGGQSWLNGTYTATFVGPSNVTWPGGTVPRSVSGSLSASGTATQSLANNNTITPSPTFWTFTVCPAAGVSSGCFTTTSIAVTTPSQAVTINPPAISIPASSTNSPVGAYADAEITSNAFVGAVYSQITSTTVNQRICQAVSGNTCSSWSATGTAIGGVNIGSATNAIYATASKYGVTPGFFVADAVTNSTTTITSASAHFLTNAKVGWQIFSVNSTGAAPGPLSTPLGTIQTISNDTTIVVSNASTVSASGQILLIAPDSTAGLTSFWTDEMNSVPFTCGVLPSGVIFTSASQFLDGRAAHPNADCLTAAGPGFAIVVPTPGFNFATCNVQSACFMTDQNHAAYMQPNYDVWENIEIWGGGNNLTGVNVGAVNGVTWNAVMARNIWLWEWGGANTGTMEPFVMTGPVVTWDLVSFNFGQELSSCGGGTPGSCVFTNSFFNKFTTTSGITSSTQNQYGSGGGGGGSTATVGTGSTFNSSGDEFFGAAFSLNCVGRCNVAGGYLFNANAAGEALLIQTGGRAYVGGTTITASGGSGVAIDRQGTGVYISGPDNTITAGTATSQVPTCAMTTGGGTGPACALIAGSLNEKGTIRMTPGTTPGATGTTTLTFAGTFTGETGASPSCTFSYANTGTGAWSLTTTTPIVMTTRSTTAPVFNWNQTGALTAASTYDIDYVCGAR